MSAAEGLSRWFRPLRGKAPVTVSAGLEHSPRQRIKDQPGGLEWSGYETDFFVPVSQDCEEEWALTGDFSLADVRTEAVLPDSGTAFPDRLWDIELGLLHRRLLANRWTLGMNVSVSSPSDRPFNGWDETAVGLNAFLKIPENRQNAWVVFLNYSSNREFLPHVPIPGGGYLYAPSRDFTALVGIPLLFFRYRPIPPLSFGGAYFPIHSISVNGEFAFSRRFSVFTGFRWVNIRYYRAKREDKEDRLFLYAKRIESGIKIKAPAGFEAEIAGAYAFDRFFFEGEGYDDRLDNRVEIGDGFIFRVNLTASF